MKKIALNLLMLSISGCLILVSCKKEESTKSPSNNSTENSLTAIVDGKSFTMENYMSSNGGTPSFRATNTKGAYISFSVNDIKPGTYVIVNTVFPDSAHSAAAQYSDSLGTYNGISGSVNITKADTTLYGFNILETTFNFVTDTTGRKPLHTITNGKVTYKFQ